MEGTKTLMKNKKDSKVLKQDRKGKPRSEIADAKN